MDLDDYLQKLNDKMTMTTNDNVGWFKLICRLENMLFEVFSYLCNVICIPHFALFYPVFWPR